MAFTKFASFEVSRIVSVKGAPTRQRTATLDKVSDYENYRTGDGYLYARIIAQSSRVNKNHDGWPSIELAGGEDSWNDITAHKQAGGSIVAQSSAKHKLGYSTFVGKPIFVDHHNSDPDRARGVIVDSKLHVHDEKVAAADDYWSSDSVDPEHNPPTEIELLLEVDAKSFPKLAEAIVKGANDPDKGIDGFSMGCDVEYSKCSHCGNKATNPDEYCSHIRMKGAEQKVTSGRHAGRSRKSYENCYGIHYFEISAVFDPADETALTQELINEQPQRESKVAAPMLPEMGPDPVNQVLDSARPQADDAAIQAKVQELMARVPNMDPDAALNLATRLADQEARQSPGVTQAMPGEGPPAPPIAPMADQLPKGPWPNQNLAPGPVYNQVPQDPDGAPPGFGGAAQDELMKAWPGFQNLHKNDPKWSSYPSYLTARTAMLKEAQPEEPQNDHIKAPENVDTLREEKICPICGSDMENDKCDVCGYDEPPEQLQNPDLTKHDEMGDEADGLVDTQPPGDPNADNAEKLPGSYLQNRKSPQTPAVTNSEPSAVASHVVASGGDEPSDETVKNDQTTPVTSAFKTAQDLIRATQEKKMAATRTAANGPADQSGNPDKRVNVDGVGGVMDDSNEQASKPDATTTVDGKGGVYQDSNAEASKPDHKESLPTAGKDSDDSGFNKDKTTDDSGKTRTWDNSNEPGSAVTDKAWPNTERGAARQAGDDRPWPHGDDALAQGGSAKQGVKPNGGADVQPQRRENVLEHSTSPANNSGPTDTWSGTGGNGVTKQTDPVTKKVDPNIDVKKSFTLSALKLAETEIELGLLDPAEKYNRIVELQEQPEEVVDAQQATLARVKTASFRRNAATESKGLGRLPAFNRIASTVDAEETTKVASVDDGMLDSALFSR